MVGIAYSLTVTAWEALWPSGHRCMAWDPERDSSLLCGSSPGRSERGWETRTWCPQSWVRDEEGRWVQGGPGGSAVSVAVALLVASSHLPWMVGQRLPSGLEGEGLPSPHSHRPGHLYALTHTWRVGWWSSGKEGGRDRLMKWQSVLITCKVFN